MRIASLSGSGIPVIAVGNDPAVVRSWNLFPGVTGLALNLAGLSSSAKDVRLINTLLERELVNEDDYALILSTQSDNTHLSGNLLRTLNIQSWLNDVTERKRPSAVEVV